MDNSLHELGEAYSTDRLMYWVNKLEPDEFIVPDVWQDMQGSIDNAAENLAFIRRMALNVMRLHKKYKELQLSEQLDLL